MTFPYALEILRTRALARQDAPQYARLCDETGINPEDKFLYEKGMEVFKTPEREKTKKELFLADANKLSIDTILSLSSGINEKIRILQLHFPRRFGKNAPQDLRNYDDAEVGAVFRGMYSGYNKRNN